MSLMPMKSIMGHWRLALAGVSGAVIACIAVVSISDTSTAKAESHESATPPVAPLRQASVSTWLISEGIEPATLAAAGASAAEATTIVTAAKEYIASSAGEELAASRRSVETARRELRAAETSAKAGAESAQTIENARVSLATAESQFSGLRASFRAAVLTGVSEAKISVIDTIRRNRPSGLPVQYLAADRSSEDAMKLRDALADARIAAQRGESLGTVAESIIASAASNSEVATAKANLDSTHNAIREAWNSAVAQE